MSVASPAARSLFRSSLAAKAPSTTCTAAGSAPGACHHFHSSSQLAARRKPRFKNVSAEKMGLVSSPEKLKAYNEKFFPEYNPKDKRILSKKYSPEQMAALQAGEAAVDPSDLSLQGRIRTDPYKFQYLEDFSTVRPVIDKRVKTHTPVDPNAHWMTPDEFNDDFIEWATGLSQEKGIEDTDIERLYSEFKSKMLNKKPGEGVTPDEMNEILDDVLEQSGNSKKPTSVIDEEPSDLEMYKYFMDRNSMTGYDGGDTALAPALPEKVPGVEGLYKKLEDPADAGLDPEGHYQELKKQTGMSLHDLLAFEKSAKILVTRWVSNQTRLGKIRSSYVLAIAGNQDGRLGLGEAKSVDSLIATKKAKLMAIRNMKPIRRYENRTIFGNVEAKVGGTIVQMMSRPPGFGLRVSHRIFEMARASGIHDLAAKMPRSRNPMNSVKAAYQALTNQPDPEQIAIGRGKKLVDARKVYFGGAVF